MRIGGIDPSSSICGVAVVVDGELTKSTHWKRQKGGSDPQRLYEYFIWLMAWLVSETPLDIVVVESLSVTQGADVTRKISHYQAVSVLCCKLRGITVIEARVSEARKHALGKGNYSKEEAWAMMRIKYDKHSFALAKSGGYDEADAGVLALAGPSIAES